MQIPVDVPASEARSGTRRGLVAFLNHAASSSAGSDTRTGPPDRKAAHEAQAVASAPPGLVKYPSPLRPSVLSRLHLAVDVTVRAAARVAAFVHALGVEVAGGVEPEAP